MLCDRDYRIKDNKETHRKTKLSGNGCWLLQSSWQDSGYEKTTKIDVGMINISLMLEIYVNVGGRSIPFDRTAVNCQRINKFLTKR